MYASSSSRVSAIRVFQGPLAPLRAGLSAFKLSLVGPGDEATVTKMPKVDPDGNESTFYVASSGGYNDRGLKIAFDELV